MKSMIRKLILSAAGMAAIIVVFVLAYKAYFVAYITIDGVTVDCFGRTSFVSPWPMQLLHIPEWPGLLWFIVNLIIFVGGISIGIKIIKHGYFLESKKANVRKTVSSKLIETTRGPRN